MAQEPLVELVGVVKHYPVHSSGLRHREGPLVHAVNDVTFRIDRGTTFGLVGESGCGKSTLARLVLGFESPTAGEVVFDGQTIMADRIPRRDPFRRRAQLVMQDPFESLNPRMKVGAIVSEPLQALEGLSRRDRLKRAGEVLELVGLDADAIRLYPHEFSGGQRQRIAVARALVVRPEMLVLDEPTASLDVSIRAQLLNLLRDLQAQFGLTYLLITHDLAVVRHVADVTAVMYLGKIMEMGTTESVFFEPQNPYTRALLDAIPDMDRKRDPDTLRSEVPNPITLPPGCVFSTRCPDAVDICKEKPPELRVSARSGSMCRCHLVASTQD